MPKFLRKVGTKVLKGQLERFAPPNPLYEFYTDERGKRRRKERSVPPGLSSRDARILKSVRRRAHYLDNGFSICGFCFGWTFIIRIIRGAGNIALVCLNYFLVVRKACQADLPAWLVQRMLLNNAVPALSGLIPVVGDMVFAAFKANSRNAALLEEFLRIRGEESLKLQAVKEGEQQPTGTDVVPSGIPKDEKVESGTGMKNASAGQTGASSGTPSGNRSFMSWRGKKDEVSGKASS